MTVQTDGHLNVEFVTASLASVIDALRERLHDVHAEAADAPLLDWKIEPRRWCVPPSRANGTACSLTKA